MNGEKLLVSTKRDPLFIIRGLEKKYQASKCHIDDDIGVLISQQYLQRHVFMILQTNKVSGMSVKACHCGTAVTWRKTETFCSPCREDYLEL